MWHEAAQPVGDGILGGLGFGAGGGIVLQPLWFLGVYIVVIALTPVTLRWHERWGGWVVVVLLAVRPAQRRTGIGRQLLEWLIESAHTAGMESLHLELRAGNEAGHAFYRAMGFCETITVPGYYRGREAALRMLRMLRVPGPPAYSWRPPTLGQK